MRTIVALVLVVAAFLCEAADRKGRLCVEREPCTSAPATGADVARSEQRRSFVWTDDRGDPIVLGVIDEGLSRAAFSASGRVRLRISGGAVEDATLIVKRGPLSWRVPLSRRQVRSGIELRIDPGEYEMTAESAGHQRLTHNVRVIAERPVLASFALQLLPRISGRVVTNVTSEPIVSASVSIEHDVVAVTDAQGRFAFAAGPETWPASMSVSAAGYGTLVMALPRARANADLFDIRLVRGVTIGVTLDRGSVAEGVRVELFERTRGGIGEVPVASRWIEPESTRATFDGVAPGDYLLLASGDAACERYGKTVSAGSDDSPNVSVRLAPVSMAIRVEMRDAPLPDAHIRLSNRDGLWDAELRADAAGDLDVVTWQLGTFRALVFAEGIMTSPHRAERSFAEADDDLAWTIAVSTREVRGRVVDAETAAPVAGANIALQVKGPGGYGTLTQSDVAGRFVFTAVIPGDHILRAAADGYQNASTRYSFAEAEQVHELTISLRAAQLVRLKVLDSAGWPIPGAAVLDFTGEVLSGERFTDAGGHVLIPRGAGESRTVFVIPRDGSFAVATVGAKDEESIVVPAPQSTLVVRSLTTGQEPIPGIWTVIRYNGIALPFEVQQTLARQQGTVSVSGSDGRIVLRQMPAGTYEFWPVGSPAEVRAVMAGLAGKAPAMIAARPGVNEAVLTFERAD